MDLLSKGTESGRGAGAAGDDNAVGADDFEIVLPLDADGFFLLEPGFAPDEIDVVAFELVADEIELGVDDLLGDVDEVGDGDHAFDAIAFAEE